MDLGTACSFISAQCIHFFNWNEFCFFVFRLLLPKILSLQDLLQLCSKWCWHLDYYLSSKLPAYSSSQFCGLKLQLDQYLCSLWVVYSSNSSVTTLSGWITQACSHVWNVSGYWLQPQKLCDPYFKKQRRVISSVCTGEQYVSKVVACVPSVSTCSFTAIHVQTAENSVFSQCVCVPCNFKPKLLTASLGFHGLEMAVTIYHLR